MSFAIARSLCIQPMFSIHQIYLTHSLHLPSAPSHQINLFKKCYFFFYYFRSFDKLIEMQRENGHNRLRYNTIKQEEGRSEWTLKRRRLRSLVEWAIFCHSLSFVLIELLSFWLLFGESSVWDRFMSVGGQCALISICLLFNQSLPPRPTPSHLLSHSTLANLYPVYLLFFIYSLCLFLCLLLVVC